jgi:2,5-diketo-D-gluconate reductase A
MSLGDGATMPFVGFGCYQIKDDAVEAVTLEALKLGYRHVDTAEVYRNERGVGAALASSNIPRAELFVTTKLWPGNPDWNQEPKTYESTIESCKASLAKLGLEHVDLYLIHGPFGGGKEGRLAQYRGILECQRQGLCKSIGVSNFGVLHLQEIEDAGLPLPATNQIELHPFCQKPEILAYMASKQIAPIAYSSLAPLSTWREGGQSAKTTDARSEASPFEAISQAHSAGGGGTMSEAQVLLRWALQRGFAILPKSTHPERIASNADLFSPSLHALSVDEMATLNSLDRNQFLAFGSPEVPFDPSTVP